MVDKGGCVALQLSDDIARTVLSFKPVFEKGFCRLPKIEFRIQLSSQAFDIKERFLQQHELRLNFHVKA